MAIDLKSEVKDLKEMVENTNPERKEGPVAKAIEEQTSRLPSDLFLWASLGAMAGALTLKLLKKDHLALFIGQWAAPFLLLGVYNKIVKLEGHDRTDHGENDNVNAKAVTESIKSERKKSERKKSYAY